MEFRFKAEAKSMIGASRAVSKAAGGQILLPGPGMLPHTGVNKSLNFPSEPKSINHAPTTQVQREE